MSQQIALLRGINIGSRRRIAMADLRKLLCELGYTDVKTYLQSGNAVFSSKKAPGKVETELQQAIAKQLGVDTPVIVRTRDELLTVIESNPFEGIATNPKRYQVSFLSEEPDPERLNALEQIDYEPERYVHVGREIYAWHPETIRNSKLAAALTDKKLGVTVTARNWNTVTNLLQLADSLRR